MYHFVSVNSPRIYPLNYFYAKVRNNFLAKAQPHSQCCPAVAMSEHAETGDGSVNVRDYRDIQAVLIPNASLSPLDDCSDGDAMCGV